MTLAPHSYLIRHPRGFQIPSGPDSFKKSKISNLEKPGSDEEIAFLSIPELGTLLRSGQITSFQLTSIYLDRLKKFNATLKCAITLTEELAMQQARRADEELQKGLDRGPLHGIPYGIKDLAAVRNYPTTWGSRPYKDQVIDEDAAIVTAS